VRGRRKGRSGRVGVAVTGGGGISTNNSERQGAAASAATLTFTSSARPASMRSVIGNTVSALAQEFGCEPGA
jgi:hypothetical protein